jgi:hypothetical protein
MIFQVNNNLEYNVAISHLILHLILLIQPEITNQIILARRYRVIKIVGEGAFSKTVCAEDLYRNRSLVAVKIMVSKYNYLGFEVYIHIQFYLDINSISNFNENYCFFRNVKSYAT